MIAQTFGDERMGRTRMLKWQISRSPGPNKARQVNIKFKSVFITFSVMKGIL
jgi:hypothetical protein